MKYKALALSMVLAGTCASMNAQDYNYTTEKWSDNIFVSAGIGIHSVYDGGFGAVAPHASISLGKLITPTWGVRAQVNGWQQHLNVDGVDMKHRKNYIGANIDAMINLSSLIAGANPNRAFEVYGFVGPSISVAKSQNVVYTADANTGDVEKSLSGENKLHSRVGASAGLGLKYNINNKWAIDLEGRSNVAPSIFGNISNHRKAEGTGMITIGATYIFGGKKFVKPEAASKVVEKVVEKEVVKEVPVEVVKEVVKEVPGQASAAIFFKIGKAVISDEGMVNVKLMAKVIKNNPNSKYEVAGYADKGTGSAAGNQTLSEKRAQAVYDALISEGVSADQLIKVGKGGTDPMFEKANLNRVVILEVK